MLRLSLRKETFKAAEHALYTYHHTSMCRMQTNFKLIFKLLI